MKLRGSSRIASPMGRFPSAPFVLSPCSSSSSSSSIPSCSPSAPHLCQIDHDSPRTAPDVTSAHIPSFHDDNTNHFFLTPLDTHLHSALYCPMPVPAPHTTHLCTLVNMLYPLPPSHPHPVTRSSQTLAAPPGCRPDTTAHAAPRPTYCACCTTQP